MNIGKFCLAAMLLGAVVASSTLQAGPHEDVKHKSHKIAFHDQDKITLGTLEADVPRLSRLMQGVQDAATIKNVKEVIKHAEKIIKAGRQAKPEAVKKALSTVQKAMTYLKQKKARHSSSSSSSSCNVCSELSELESEIDDCCKAIKAEILDILEVLQAEFPCGASIAIDHVPFTILESGKYCVTKDLTYFGAATAIIVQADNVTINFENHSLTLLDPNAQGILVQDVNEFTLENDIIQGSSLFQTATSAAIHLENVNKATLSNIYTLNTTFGINIVNSIDVLVEHSFMKFHEVCLAIESSTGVRIDSSIFDGSAESIESIGASIFANSANVTLSNNTFTNLMTSISALQVTGFIIEDCLAIASPMSNLSLLQIGGFNEGELANDVLIRNATFIQNTFIPEFDGLLFYQGSGCLLDNVIVDVTSGSEGEGSYLPAAFHIGCGANGDCDPHLTYSDLLGINCIVRGQNLFGLYVEDGFNITFTNSQFTDAALINVLLEGGGESGGAIFCQIKDSLIANGGEFGVVMDDFARSNAIVNCEVTNSGNAGVYIDTSCFSNQVRGNRVFGNSNGIFNQSATTETYFNTSCNNFFSNCIGVNPAQAPNDGVEAGSNVCCPIED